MNYIELKNIGFLFLQSVYNSLGISQLLNQIKSDSKIEYDLNGLTKLLVFGRILNPQSKKKTFEENLQELEAIVTKLENGDVALEDAIEAFQQGMILSKELQKTLDSAEKTLVKVMQADGTETEMDA